MLKRVISIVLLVAVFVVAVVLSILARVHTFASECRIRSDTDDVGGLT